jgi:hypothetical protein
MHPGSLCAGGDGGPMLGSVCACGHGGPMLGVGLAILALGSEPMLRDPWLLAKILCSTCSNRSKCRAHVVVPLLHCL